MQIKTTMTCQLTLARIAIVKKMNDDKCWRRYGEKHCALLVKMLISSAAIMEKQCGGTLNN
jgi:hypothetical protein